MCVTAVTLATFVVTGLTVPASVRTTREGVLLAGATRATTRRPNLLPQDQYGTDLRLRSYLRARTADRASREGQIRTTQVLAVVTARRRAAAERARARDAWVAPLLSYRLTAGFGAVSGLWSRAHTGQDFAAPAGTPVRAVARGRVVSAAWDGSYGLKIAIEHADGTVTWYAHLSQALVTSGEVQAGQTIGEVGSTGNVTGPHLHLEVRPRGGSPISPLPWLRAHGADV